MTGAWYWYVEEGCYGMDNAVRIHEEKPGKVVGSHWVIPFKDSNYDRWHIYLHPRWLVEKDPDMRAAASSGFDCEWVFVKRVKWEPPPKEAYSYSCTSCPTCGQEIEL